MMFRCCASVTCGAFVTNQLSHGVVVKLIGRLICRPHLNGGTRFGSINTGETTRRE